MLKNLQDFKSKTEINTDDAPEEFLDPVTYSLMEDPVELPDSKTVIDRITIKKHLMNDPSDPFTRAPLALENVITRDDIKKLIE